MGSWSRKIYLSFWVSLAFFTVIAVVWVPRFLDEGKGDSVKELQPAPKASTDAQVSAGSDTRFPTRAFASSVSSSGQGPLPSRDVDSQSQPEEDSNGGTGGLPSRTVPGVDNGQAISDRVTTRAYLQANSSVFLRPQTTAQVLGRVGSLTKVRWLDKAGEGWEEILLKDGRSAYVQSKDLSFTSEVTTQAQSGGFDNRPSQRSQADLGTLPQTVERFLSYLSANDVLRAETYLSPQAPNLSESTLSTLGPYAGAPSEGRVLRIEGGSHPSERTVRIVFGPGMEHETLTVWEWDAGQKRWLLKTWP